MKIIVRSLTLALALVATALSPVVQAAGGHGGGGGGSGGGHGGGGGGYGGGHGGYGGGYGGGHGGYGGGYGGGHGGYGGGYYGGYGHGWGGYGLGIFYGGGYGYYGGGYGYNGGGYGVYAPSYYYGVEPATAGSVQQAGQPVPQVSRAPDPIFYPRNGQSAATAESDQVECNRWATTQRGAVNDASIFQRATVACMEGRGYTVR